MKSLFFTLILLSKLTFASIEVKVGDVLLQPLDCWACSLIEAEEETIYSHIGIVLAVKPEILVGEAFGTVRAIPLKVFIEKTQSSQRLSVLRFQNDELFEQFQKNVTKLNVIFKNDFENSRYDHDFRWNNVDEAGNEKLYCSEFVSKLIQAFASVETPVKRMHFKQNRDQWIKYFRGDVPDGLWGNSPGDFERSELFYTVGEL